MNQNLADEIIALATSDGLTMLHLRQILYVESNGNYSRLHLLDGGSILVTKQLKEVEAFLDDVCFLRVHHKFIICKLHVREYNKKDSQLILATKKMIPVSVRKRQSLTTFFRTL